MRTHKNTLICDDKFLFIKIKKERIQSNKFEDSIVQKQLVGVDRLKWKNKLYDKNTKV